MGTVLRFPLHQARASRNSGRAAKATIKSGVTPAPLAGAETSTADHHSEGMLSRCHHLLTCEALAPTSAAQASRVDQSSMIERKEVASDMPHFLGRSVLDCKAELSCDTQLMSGHYVRMGSKNETEERERFIRRTKEARMSRYETQQPMLTLLELEQGTYKQYETRTPLPHRFIPKFCAATGVSMEWLLTGEGKGPATMASLPLAKITHKRIKRA